MIYFCQNDSTSKTRASHQVTVFLFPWRPFGTKNEEMESYDIVHNEDVCTAYVFISYLVM